MSKRAKQLVAAGRGGGDEPPERPKKTPRKALPQVSPFKKALWKKEANRFYFDEDSKEREFYWIDDPILRVSLNTPIASLRVEYGSQIARIARYYGATVSWNTISATATLGYQLERWRREYMERIQPAVNVMNTRMDSDSFRLVTEYLAGTVRDDLLTIFRKLRPVPADWEPEIIPHE